MFKTVLSDPRLERAEFLLADATIVRIPACELRRVLPKLPAHYGDKIWGPFDIVPRDSRINNELVEMEVVDPE